MSEPGPEVMARFVGSENVERGRAYLEGLDPEFHRILVDGWYVRDLCRHAEPAGLEGWSLQLDAGIKDEVHPFQVKHTNNAMRLHATKTEKMYLYHLRNVFCKMHALGNQEDEEESEPII